MFSLGFVLWLLITVFLLGFAGWTNYILFNQKRVWKAFAAKKSLRYRSNALLESSDVSGAYEGFQLTIFATDHGMGDVRSRKVMSTIEVSLKSSLPSPCAVASGGMVKLVESLELTQEYRPDHPAWDISFIARTRDQSVLETYLTPARVEALARMMKRKKCWMILIFSGEMGLLRLDTSDALDKGPELEKLVEAMITLARVLELEAGEDKIIATRKKREEPKPNTLRVDEKIIDTSIGLSLEDDG